MTGAKLREARKAAKLSIKKAAELSGTPYRTWQNWEAEGKEHRRPPGIAFSWLQLYMRLQQTLYAKTEMQSTYQIVP